MMELRDLLKPGQARRLCWQLLQMECQESMQIAEAHALVQPVMFL